MGDRLSFRVEEQLISANYKGFYNVYNILAAYAGVRTAGFAGEHFNDMLRFFARLFAQPFICYYHQFFGVHIPNHFYRFILRSLVSVIITLPVISLRFNKRL